jgi:hypothetical protein
MRAIPKHHRASVMSLLLAGPVCEHVRSLCRLLAKRVRAVPEHHRASSIILAKCARAITEHHNKYRFFWRLPEKCARAITQSHRAFPSMPDNSDASWPSVRAPPPSITEHHRSFWRLLALLIHHYRASPISLSPAGLACAPLFTITEHLRSFCRLLACARVPLPSICDQSVACWPKVRAITYHHRSSPISFLPAGAIIVHHQPSPII